MKKYLQPIFLEGLQGTLSLSLSLPLSLFLIFIGFPLLMSHFNILHCPFQECRVRDRYIDSEHFLFHVFLNCKCPGVTFIPTNARTKS